MTLKDIVCPVMTLTTGVSYFFDVATQVCWLNSYLKPMLVLLWAIVTIWQPSSSFGLAWAYGITALTEDTVILLRRNVFTTLALNICMLPLIASLGLHGICLAKAYANPQVSSNVD